MMTKPHPALAWALEVELETIRKLIDINKQTQSQYQPDECEYSYHQGVVTTLEVRAESLDNILRTNQDLQAKQTKSE